MADLIHPQTTVLATILFIILLLIAPATANNTTDTSVISPLPGDANTSVTVFYSSGCSACRTTIPWIQNLSKEFPEVPVRFFDTSLSAENKTMMLAFGEKYGEAYPSYPVVFAGDATVLNGKLKIESNLKAVFEAYISGEMPDKEFESSLTETTATPTTPADNSTATAPVTRGVTVLMVILAGLADGINPCAISVLALLLVALSARTSRGQVIMSGFLYTAAVFTFYVLAGLGLLTFVGAAGVSQWFTLFAGIFATGAGIVTVASALVRRPDLSPKIPESGRPVISGLMKSASLPAAFALGVVVGLFELPCTGGIYIAILGLLSAEAGIDGLVYLLIYNLMFIVPLIAIVLGVAFGLSPERVDSWRESNKRLLRVAIGLLIIAMGLYLLSG